MPQQVISQTDFSAGEVDATIDRSEDLPEFKKGLRQCRNFNILDTKKLSNRFGRTVKFIDGQRCEEVLMSPGNIFYLVFGNGSLSVRNSAGQLVFTTTKKGDGSTAIPWTSTTARQITWDVYGLQIFIFYADGAPSNVPQVLTWDGVATWTLSTYAELVTGGQKRTYFARISPTGVTMQPSATTGNINLTFSSPIAVAGMINTRFRYIGRQVLVTGLTTSSVLTATVQEPLLGSQTLTFGANNPATVFSIGDVLIGATTGAKGIAISFGATTAVVQLIAPASFGVEGVSGPGGSLSTSAVSAVGAPQAVAIWEDEVMNTFRGFPSSVAVDQTRLALMNFPSIPGGIGYSAIGSFTDLYVPFTGVSASNAIFEIAPGKSQILYMTAGPEGSEYIFCDNAVYYFPITLQNPLSATVGISFNKITDDGCANVQPRRLQNMIVYINAGNSSVRALMTTGAVLRPNESRDISELHNHLFTGPVAIACPNADSSFPERFFYVLNADGTIAVGRVDVEDGQIKENTLPGWSVHSGAGTTVWVGARGPNVLFTTTYAIGGAAPVTVAEQLDPTQFVDAAMSYNSAPVALTPPVGKGPLWWLANGTVTTMDLGTRQLDTYNVDGNGYLIPQNIGGENLASAQLVVGQPWTAIAEPFCPGAPAGQDLKQRLMERAVTTFAVYVKNCTGFLFQTLFNSRQTRTSMALGTVSQQMRVPTYAVDDDPTIAPFQQEGIRIYKPLGKSFSPRNAIVKDTAGPLVISEIAQEITI